MAKSILQNCEEGRGNRLKEKRLALGLTQAEVAGAVGIAESAYQRYEYGTRIPNVFMAIQIAKALETTVEDLFGRE